LFEPLDEKKPAVCLEALVDEWPLDIAALLNIIESSPYLRQPDAMLPPDAGKYMRLDQIHERKVLPSGIVQSKYRLDPPETEGPMS